MSSKRAVTIAILFTCLVPGVFFGTFIITHSQQRVVGFAHQSYTVREDDGEVLIPIVIDSTPAAGETVVVEFFTVPGTAAEGPDGDYLHSSTTLTFTRRSDTVQFGFVTLVNDEVAAEADETVNLILRLLTPDTATLGHDIALLIVIDDDPPLREEAYVQPVFGEGLLPTSTPPPPPP